MVTDLVDGPLTRKIENSMEIPKEKRIYELGSLPPFWCSAATWKQFTTDGTSRRLGNALPCRSSLGPLRPLQTPSKSPSRSASSSTSSPSTNTSAIFYVLAQLREDYCLIIYLFTEIIDA
ncbi:hypothetical protein EV1_035277 [Malus domestica]